MTFINLCSFSFDKMSTVMDLVFSICWKHDSKSEVYQRKEQYDEKNKQLLTDGHVLNSTIFPITRNATDNTHVMSPNTLQNLPMSSMSSCR